MYTQQELIGSNYNNIQKKFAKLSVQQNLN